VTAATVRDCIIGHFGDNLDIVQKLGLSNKSFGWYTEKSNFSQFNNSYKLYLQINNYCKKLNPISLPILLYALEVCNLDNRILQSLDFTVNRFFMKLFRTSNIEIVHYCQTVFGCELPSVLLVTRYDKFIKKSACNPL